MILYDCKSRRLWSTIDCGGFSSEPKGMDIEILAVAYTSHFKVGVYVLLYCWFEGPGAAASSTAVSGYCITHCNIILLYYCVTAPWGNSVKDNCLDNILYSGGWYTNKFSAVIELRLFGASGHCAHTNNYRLLYIILYIYYLYTK